MREFDADGLLVCKYQASIFERSLIKTECGSAVFIRRFMNSDVTAHLDTSTFANEATAPDEAFDLIDKQYGPSTYGSERYSADELYWMGYLYRYWAYVYGTRSSNIYKKIGARTCGPYILLIIRWILHRRLSVLRRQGGSRWPL